MIYPNRRYQIYLKSPSAPIKVYLLSNDGNQQQDEQEQAGASTGEHSSQQGVTDAMSIEASAAGQRASGGGSGGGLMQSLQQLEPPVTDPDFIYSMDPAHEGISDLYRDDTGGSRGLLFDAD